MKRWPTPGRIILGVLLLSAAAAVVAFWPHVSLCQVPLENMVGFDEAQGLFYTTQMIDGGQKINAYELATGAKRSSVSIPLPEVRDGQPYWPCRLSGDKRFLIATSLWQDQVLIYQLPLLTPVRFDYSPEADRQIWAIGFSVDGGALMLQSLGDHSDLIQVLELNTSNVQVARIKYPLPVSRSGFGRNSMPPDSMHMSADRRYLATNVTTSTNAVYDMVEKKELFRTTESKGIARFMSDGQTLVFLPQNSPGANLGIPINDPGAGEANWYRLENEQWTLSAKRKIELAENEQILQAGNQYFITARSDNTEHAWLKHLPEFLRSKVATLMASERVHLRFWDLTSGQLVPELNLTIPFKNRDVGLYSGFESNSRKLLMVSADGKYVATNMDNVITVWESQPRRSLACWLTALCLTLLAGWFVWPRRVKVASAS